MWRNLKTNVAILKLQQCSTGKQTGAGFMNRLISLESDSKVETLSQILEIFC